MEARFKLVNLLINKNRFEEAKQQLDYLRKKYKDDTKKVVIAYNSGYYNPNNVSYYKKFLKNKKLFKEFEIRYLKNKDEYNG